MKTVFIKYHTGAETIFHTMLDSVELFCNEHFGSTWPVARENGTIVHMEDHQPEAELGTHVYDAVPQSTVVTSNPLEDEPPVTRHTQDAVLTLTSTEATTGTGGAGAPA